MLPKELSKLNLVYLARGKRSLIYTFKKGKKKFALKIEDEQSGAKGRIKNEVKFLKILNKINIGAKLISWKENYFVYEFVEGDLILDYINKTKNPFPVLIKILKQCRVLDKLKINKLEMHHPLKHIFVKKNKVTMIDFERAYFTKKPKNVTQFCQFLMRNKNLELNKEKVINSLKEYKTDQSEQNFEKVLSFFF